MKTGYARVSSCSQSLAIQEARLLEAGCDPEHLYREKCIFLYRVTVNTRQHCTDNTEGAQPSNTNIRATLRRCTVGKLSAHC